MSTAAPLIVPIEVDALVVNNGSVNFIRAAMDYGGFAEYASVAPPPFAQADENFAAEPANQGVYVMWTLPKTLRRGAHSGDATTFPFVPNRWLVVRTLRAQGAPTAAAPGVQAWVVISDALTPNGTTYVDPTQTTLTPAGIGANVIVTAANPFVDPGSPAQPFLQAVAESNPAFAAYQPFNQNVFSLFDNLQTQGQPAASVSYSVFGWYSDSAADVLAGLTTADAFTTQMRALQWTASQAQTCTDMSVYQGSAFGVQWTPGGAPLSSAPLYTQTEVSLANTSVDGTVAFIEAAVQTEIDAGHPGPDGLTPQQVADLLEAFQYNQLPVLGTPGAESVLEQTIRSWWFASTPGGTSYEIVAAEQPGTSSPPQPLSPAELAKEAQWLGALNLAQARFDARVRELAGVQRRLYDLWWKQGSADAYYATWGSFPTGVDDDAQFTAALAPLQTQAATLLTELAGFAQNLPVRAAGTSLQAALDAFAATRGLPATRRLKAVSEARFWRAQDPVIVISGLDNPSKLDPSETLACRWPSEIVTALAVGTGSDAFTVTAAQLASAVPAMNVTNLPALAVPLFAESFLLDPSNIALLANAAQQQRTAAQLAALQAQMTPPQPNTGIAPDVVTPFPWVQPWKPLYLDWELNWYPLPLHANGDAQWSFDGVDYDLAAGLAQPQPISVVGRSILTPKPSFEFHSRIIQFITDYPDSPVKTELADIETVAAWNFVSQTLSGLSTQLSMWNPVPTISPTGTLATLVGNAAQNPPLPGGYQPDDPTPPGLEGIRAGQFSIARLTVVDAFGQTLEIIATGTGRSGVNAYPAESYAPVLANGLIPTYPIDTYNPQTLAQLPPRVLQPARLNFAFVGDDADGSPILGWLLPNHLDGALAVYGADGSAYGELAPIAAAPFIGWSAAPNAPAQAQSLGALTAAEPQLGGILAGLVAQGSDAFAAFLACIDETLWTVDPLGGRSDAMLSVLVGRPLAVVDVALSLELQTTPLYDVSWPATFVPTDATFVASAFPVQVGDVGFGEDGLVGYFVGDDFSQCNVVQLPSRGELTSAYVRQIGVGDGSQPPNFIDLRFARSRPGTAVALTVLMDPRASVHASTGILPTKAVTLVPQWVDAPLQQMALTFRAGPVFDRAIPQPAEKHGTWSWTEPLADGTWTANAPLDATDATAQFPEKQPTLREGRLVLTAPLQGKAP